MPNGHPELTSSTRSSVSPARGRGHRGLIPSARLGLYRSRWLRWSAHVDRAGGPPARRRWVIEWRNPARRGSWWPMRRRPRDVRAVAEGAAVMATPSQPGVRDGEFHRLPHTCERWRTCPIASAPGLGHDYDATPRRGRGGRRSFEPWNRGVLLPVVLPLDGVVDRLPPGEPWPDVVAAPRRVCVLMAAPTRTAVPRVRHLALRARASRAEADRGQGHERPLPRPAPGAVAVEPHGRPRHDVRLHP